MIDAIAVMGDAGDINCWSGISYHFRRAALEKGERAMAWRVKVPAFQTSRRLWNCRQVLLGRGLGGYQYSSAFLDRAEAEIPADHWQGRILTFSQHFPRGKSVTKKGGRSVHYVDATFASFCAPDGLVARLPEKARREARTLEQENYHVSERVVTMSRWAADSVIRECGVSPAKVQVILPGANLYLPTDYGFPVAPGQPGQDRPLVLGFVGKDWKRKGLPFLLKLRAVLERMGMRAVVRCVGNCPSELRRESGLEFLGFIDKSKEPVRFLEFLAGCDLGCLFSEREPLGISTLEFLRAGVPVAGYLVEGTADTIPPDAGFRFEAGTSAETVASALRVAFQDEARVAALRASARSWSPLVTWERCVDEWRELLATGKIKRPVQLWQGP